MSTTRELTPLKKPLGLRDFSRFLRQLQYFNLDGRVFYGTWVPPAFPVSPVDTFHTVVEGQERRLDLISNRYYRTPELWWILATVNNVLSPFDDLLPGAVLRIPSLNTVTAYLSSS